MMTEPTTTTGVLWAVAAGTLATFFASIGVTWAVVFWALCGTLFASPVAAGIGRLRAIAMFPASVLLAAKAGGLISLHYFSGSADMAGGMAAVSGIILHPTISALVKGWPGFISRRLGLAGTDQPTKDAP
jgi:hypothetical protein